MKAFTTAMMFIMAVIVVIVFTSAWHSDDERNQKIEATTSPQEFIALEIYEPKANAEVRRIQDSLWLHIPRSMDADRELGEIELYFRA